jgi:hypothetical protein
LASPLPIDVGAFFFNARTLIGYERQKGQPECEKCKNGEAIKAIWGFWLHTYRQ